MCAYSLDHITPNLRSHIFIFIASHSLVLPVCNLCYLCYSHPSRQASLSPRFPLQTRKSIKSYNFNLSLYLFFFNEHRQRLCLYNSLSKLVFILCEPRLLNASLNMNTLSTLFQLALTFSSLSAYRWWVWVDSNHRPHPYQGCALTT